MNRRQEHETTPRGRLVRVLFLLLESLYVGVWLGVKISHHLHRHDSVTLHPSADPVLPLVYLGLSLVVVVLSFFMWRASRPLAILGWLTVIGTLLLSIEPSL